MLKKSENEFHLNWITSVCSEGQRHFATSLKNEVCQTLKWGPYPEKVFICYRCSICSNFENNIGILLWNCNIDLEYNWFLYLREPKISSHLWSDFVSPYWSWNGNRETSLIAICVRRKDGDITSCTQSFISNGAQPQPTRNRQTVSFFVKELTWTFLNLRMVRMRTQTESYIHGLWQPQYACYTCNKI